MSVRKRRWLTPSGEAREGWVVRYTDAEGTRRLKTFETKREADDFAATARVEVRDGIHVADSASATVQKAGELWLAAADRRGRERSTLAQYQQHLRLHINPLLGTAKLTELTVPALRRFEDALLASGRSPAMARKVMVSLGSLLADSQERGLVGRNVVRDMRSRRGTTDSRAEKRAKGRLKVGIDIPSPGEITAIMGELRGRWRPLIIAAALTGLRASELRGLPWSDVDLEQKVLHVRQRADRFKAIGKPKSEAGERVVPIPPLLMNVLREWRLACPRGPLNLVFPNEAGDVQAHSPIVQDGFMVAQVRAGVVTPEGKAKYSGLHSLRHFHASWLINRRRDGGLELPLKIVQERLGHSSITMTSNVYGHLFPRAGDSEEMAAAEAVLFGIPRA